MSKFRIVIDGRMFQESGIGRYIRNLVAQLQIVDKKNEYFVLHLKDSYEELVYHDNFHKVLADFHWYGVREQIRLPKLLDSLSPDLVHFPHFNIPIFYKGKFIVTIHDLIHQHFSMQRATTHGLIVYKLKQLGYMKVFKNAIEKLLFILVPSNFVKQQLAKEWKIDTEKIIVTPEAVDEKIISIVNKMSKTEAENILDKFNIKSPYLFYVGNAHPHKNLERLIKAFLILQRRYKNLGLVLSGHDHYFWQRFKKENKYQGIIYTGFVIDKELVALYKNALAFVMPSFEEGFGIPILEAFAFSCPVVSSNAGSLPEVGGDGCVYFDPKDTDDLVEKISMLLTNKRLREQLIGKGFKRYREFSWLNLTQKTLEVYLRCA